MQPHGQSKLSETHKSAYSEAGAVSDAAWIQYQYQSGGGKGISDEALARVGEAIHTVTDETSPSHKGFQVWHGADDVVSILEATVHIGRESLHISSSQMNAAVGAAQSIFAEALPEFATQAFGQQQPTPRHDEEEQQQQQENRVHNEDTQNLEEREHKN